MTVFVYCYMLGHLVTVTCSPWQSIAARSVRSLVVRPPSTVWYGVNECVILYGCSESCARGAILAESLAHLIFCNSLGMYVA